MNGERMAIGLIVVLSVALIALLLFTDSSCPNGTSRRIATWIYSGKTITPLYECR